MGNGKFILDKWYLDFVDDDGTAMIFYAAILTWNKVPVPFTQLLIFDPELGIRVKSRFSGVSMPQRSGNIIQWEDAGFGVQGSWEGMEKAVQSKLFESKEGDLNWFCHQPASNVRIKYGGKEFLGRGYAEQLILSVLPWKIPMDKLRWGRHYSEKRSLVWVEIEGEYNKQWVWFNGNKISDCEITDHQLRCDKIKLNLTLDHLTELEKGKTIKKVMRPVSKLIPGFKRNMALKFLNADSYKWLSESQLKWEGVVTKGMTIHERVNFNTML